MRQAKTTRCKKAERARKSLVVTHQAPKTRGPSKRALHDPSTRQQHTTALGFGQFDDFQMDPVFFCGFCWNIAGGALVDKGDCDMASSHVLNGLSQFTNLGSVLLIG